MGFIYYSVLFNKISTGLTADFWPLYELMISLWKILDEWFKAAKKL